MSALSYVSLEDIRRCIRKRCLVRFMYRKVEVVAEPHLFGNFRKTRAFVLCAWKVLPQEGWECFQLAEMRDLDIVVESFGTTRQGFNPYDPTIEIVDTLVRA